MLSEPQHILVRCPNWVGDVVMATPVFRALKRRFPQAHITALIKTYAADVLRGSPCIDEIVTLESLGPTGFWGSWRRARSLKRGRFDVVLLLTNSFGSALEPWLAGIPRRVGFAGDGRSWLLTDALSGRPRLRRDEPVPMPDLYLRLAGGVGCSPEHNTYELFVTGDEDLWIQRWFERHQVPLHRPLIGLNPGAKFGASKLWEPERFAAVGDELARRTGGYVLILGGPGEESLTRAIRSSLTSSGFDTLIDRVPLGPLKALIRRLTLLVTTDTGPRAFAQAFGIPHVVVMGPTHPGWTAANLERARVVRHDVPCGPCHLKSCPLDHTCMRQITVEEVVREAVELLGVSTPR